MRSIFNRRPGQRSDTKGGSGQEQRANFLARWRWQRAANVEGVIIIFGVDTTPRFIIRCRYACFLAGGAFLVCVICIMFA